MERAKFAALQDLTYILLLDNITEIKISVYGNIFSSCRCKCGTGISFLADCRFITIHYIIICPSYENRIKERKEKNITLVAVKGIINSKDILLHYRCKSFNNQFN